MKSKMEQLESRGFVAKGIEINHLDKSFEQRIELLLSNQPINRTLGARLLAGNSNLNSIDCLIAALINEKKLYTKIEICNSLVSFGKNAVLPLINLLGKIGNNQHKEIPKTNFKKNNFPLPRDIASRTLIRIGTAAIPDLLKILDSRNISQLSETIDTIGFICFYNYQTNVFDLLKKCFSSNENNDLIKWKLIRAMSAFPESKTFLKQQQQLNNEHLNLEIERSIMLMEKH